MPRLHDQWTVLPHGPLRAIDYGLMTFVGRIPMPLGNFPRRRIPGPAQYLPSHGEIIDRQPAAELYQLAWALKD